jgi:hypothetical protein
LAKDQPDFAVLFISGEHDTSQLGEFKNPGFLGKPFSPSALVTGAQPAAEAQHRPD